MANSFMYLILRRARRPQTFQEGGKMPTHGVKTIEEIDGDYQAKMAELTGVEAKLRKLQDREGEIRTELSHLEIQRTRLLGTAK